MRMRHLLVLVLVAAGLAGCSAEGASTGNFELLPHRVGWFAGESASFDLNLTPSLLRQDPSFTIDRRFAIEEIVLNERGARFAGDWQTKDPDAVALRLVRGGVDAPEFVLDEANPGVEVHLTLPDALKDSEYALELKVFKVGWVKSEPFRVDRR